MKTIQHTIDTTNPPKDKKLFALLKQAYQGELLCYKAIISWDGIKPFSNYQPEIKEVFRQHFFKQLDASVFPPLYVYQEGDVFIMSDDYTSYNLYAECNSEQVLCVVLGQPTGDAVLTKSEAFRLPPPTFELINE